MYPGSMLSGNTDKRRKNAMTARVRKLDDIGIIVIAVKAIVLVLIINIEIKISKITSNTTT